MNEEQYHYNNEPLQLSYSNDYTPLQNIEIIENLEKDFKSGILSVEQMRWIVFGAKYGSFTIQRLIDKLMFEGKLKVNPITLDKRTFSIKPSVFDL